MEFHIGDRIIYHSRNVSNRFLDGAIGTIITTDDGGGYVEYGVVFDKYCAALHNLAGKCERGHGWWCLDRSLELLSSDDGDIDIASMDITYDDMWRQAR